MRALFCFSVTRTHFQGRTGVAVYTLLAVVEAHQLVQLDRFGKLLLQLIVEVSLQISSSG